MSDHSAIEWTDATWPVVTGCDYASPGCANCYAVRDARRLSGNPNPKVNAAYAGLVERRGEKLRWTGTVRTLPERLDWPLHWRKPRKVFVCNESDLFHPDVPDSFIDQVFAVMALTPQHTYQVLTKRAERMRAYVGGLQQRLGDLWNLTNQPAWVNLPVGRSFPRYPENWPLPNVWLGVSVENQHFADARIPLLLQTPAAVRFISAEPLLGPVDLQCLEWLRTDGGDYFDALARKRNPFDDVGLNGAALNWVIVGGESGPQSRPFDVDWAYRIVAQCRAAGVACFVKQLGSRPRPIKPLRDKKGGEISEFPKDLQVREFPK